MKITFVSSIQAQEAKHLYPKWKLTILSWLGIRPQRQYHWTIKLVVDEPIRSRIGDVIKFGGIEWLIQAINSPEITMSTICSTTMEFHRDFFFGNSASFVPMFRTYSEGEESISKGMSKNTVSRREQKDCLKQYRPIGNDINEN